MHLWTMLSSFYSSFHSCSLFPPFLVLVFFQSSLSFSLSCVFSLFFSPFLFFFPSLFSPASSSRLCSFSFLPPRDGCLVSFLQGFACQSSSTPLPSWEKDKARWGVSILLGLEFQESCHYRAVGGGFLHTSNGVSWGIT